MQLDVARQGVVIVEAPIEPSMEGLGIVKDNRFGTWMVVVPVAVAGAGVVVLHLLYRNKSVLGRMTRGRKTRKLTNMWQLWLEVERLVEVMVWHVEEGGCIRIDPL